MCAKLAEVQQQRTDPPPDRQVNDFFNLLLEPAKVVKEASADSVTGFDDWSKAFGLSTIAPTLSKPKPPEAIATK